MSLTIPKNTTKKRLFLKQYKPPQFTRKDVKQNYVFTFPNPASEDYGGFDIIVQIGTHGATCTNECRYEQKQILTNSDPYDFTIIESVPCGVNNVIEPESYIGYLEVLIEHYKDSPSFLIDIQKDMREFKASFEIGRLKDDPSYIEYAKHSGFNIIKNQGRYLERTYQQDENPVHLNIGVLYVRKGPLEMGQDLYGEINTRTKLLAFLRDKGYVSPLIIDLSCGGFHGVTEEQRIALLEEARKNKLAGYRKHRKTRKRKHK